MTVHGVGSRNYFDNRKNELLAIDAIGNKGKAVADKIDQEELSCGGLLVMIGKAFREFVEYFQDERYKKKLDKRIKVLKDPKYDDYNKKIDIFHDAFIEQIRTEAFNGFKTGLLTFTAISNDLFNEKNFGLSYPELHKQLTKACGVRKTEACIALTELPKILNAIKIDRPLSSTDKLILQLQKEFEKDSETESFLDEYLGAFKEGLNIKSNEDNALILCKFLDNKNAHLASLIPSIRAWKDEMKEQRKNLLKSLPGKTDNLLLYSFTSAQIRRVKKIVEMQRKEVNSETKLEISLAHFVADNLSLKIKSDKDVIEVGKHSLYDKFEKRKLDLFEDEKKTKKHLKNAKLSIENNDKVLKRLADIDAAKEFNNECLAILDNCFQDWVLNAQNNTSSYEASLALFISKDASLENYAELHHNVFKFPHEAEDALDAMRADASYRLFYKEVDNKTDPRPLPENVSVEQKKNLSDRAKRFVDVINELQKEHFDPLKEKLTIGQHNPHWTECVNEIINKCIPILENLNKGYIEIIQSCESVPK